MSNEAYPGSELELFQHACNWKRYFSRIVSRYLTGDVLEVGAGIGGTTPYLCDGSQSSWCCLEPDEKMAAVIQAKIDNRALPACCTAKTGTITDLQGDGRFNAVVYIDVLEHIRDDAGEILKACGLLKPGGRLVVLVPANPRLYSSFDEAVGHFRRYTARGLSSLFPEQVQRMLVMHLDSVGMLASLGNAMVLKKKRPGMAEITVWDRWMVPLSVIVDRLLCFTIGRSIVGVWRV